MMLGAVLDWDKNRFGGWCIPPARLHFNQDKEDCAARKQDDVVWILSNEFMSIILSRGEAVLLTEGTQEGLKQEEGDFSLGKHSSELRLSQILLRWRIKSITMFLSIQPHSGFSSPFFHSASLHLSCTLDNNNPFFCLFCIVFVPPYVLAPPVLSCRIFLRPGHFFISILFHICFLNILLLALNAYRVVLDFTCCLFCC